MYGASGYIRFGAFDVGLSTTSRYIRGCLRLWTRVVVLNIAGSLLFVFFYWSSLRLREVSVHSESNSWKLDRVRCASYSYGDRMRTHRDGNTFSFPCFVGDLRSSFFPSFPAGFVAWRMSKRSPAHFILAFPLVPRCAHKNIRAEQPTLFFIVGNAQDCD